MEDRLSAVRALTRGVSREKTEITAQYYYLVILIRVGLRSLTKVRARARAREISLCNHNDDKIGNRAIIYSLCERSRSSVPRRERNRKREEFYLRPEGPPRFAQSLGLR